ncbi:MAG: NERD domain-containing protein, partial [Pseudomonadota bacterium]|nr:NERD domain-containing protein [Pseudomonadota bacterium]
MAIMYPPSISAGTKSPGEIDIFEKMKYDPLTTDWVVLHSLDIAEHKRQIEGEADFVIIIPNKGVLCLE